jgi:prevent-host-death family protein
MTIIVKRWSVARAKAQLSRVLEEARVEPQTIENRGREIAVVLGTEAYRELVESAERASPAARMRRFLEKSAAIRAAGGAELELPRRTARPSPFSRKAR